MWEWNQDRYGPFGPGCANCAGLAPQALYSVIRGGGFNTGAAKLPAAYRADAYDFPAYRFFNYGVRCARTP